MMPSYVITEHDVMDAVEAVTGIPEQVILGRGRKQAIFRARALVALLLCEVLEWNHGRIARYLKRDRSTVYAMLRRVEQDFKNSEWITAPLAAAKRTLSRRKLLLGHDVIENAIRHWYRELEHHDDGYVLIKPLDLARLAEAVRSVA